MDVWSPSRHGCFTPSETLLATSGQETGWIPKLVSMLWKRRPPHGMKTRFSNTSSDFWSSWRLNVVRRTQIFAGPQYGTYFTSLMTPRILRSFLDFFKNLWTLSLHQKSHNNVGHNVSSHLSATDSQTRLRYPDSHVRTWWQLASNCR